MPKITPFLWFDTQAEEAMNLYTSIFKPSKVISVNRAQGKVMSVQFELEGQQFMGLNAGPVFKFNEAVSFFVGCETQEEIDELWSKLIADGGSPSQCGWLKDKFGLSWQIVPTALTRMLGDKDAEKSGRAMKAMLQMDEARSEAAAAGVRRQVGEAGRGSAVTVAWLFGRSFAFAPPSPVSSARGRPRAVVCRAFGPGLRGQAPPIARTLPEASR